MSQSESGRASPRAREPYNRTRTTLPGSAFSARRLNSRIRVRSGGTMSHYRTLMLQARLASLSPPFATLLDQAGDDS